MGHQGQEWVGLVGKQQQAERWKRAGKAWCWCCGLSYVPRECCEMPQRCEMPRSGRLAAPKTASNMMKKRLLHCKGRDKSDGWGRSKFLRVRGPCKEVAGSGPPSCEDALHTDVQKTANMMPRKGSLLQTACLTHVWKGHKGLRKRENLDLCPGPCFHVSFSNGSLLPSCKSIPVLPVPDHFEAHRDCQQVLHLMTSITWYILISTWLICFLMFSKAVEKFWTFGQARCEEE